MTKPKKSTINNDPPETIPEAVKQLADSMTISENHRSISHRLQGLQPDEIEKLPWIQPLVKSQISNLVIPTEPKRDEPKNPKMQCEENLEEIQDTVPPNHSPEAVLQSLKTAQDLGTYQSIPIIYETIHSSQARQFSLAFTPQPTSIKFLRIIDAVQDKTRSGTSSKVFCECYVYSDRPCSERFRMDFGDDGKPSYHVYGRQLKQPELPFSCDTTNPPRFICLLYMAGVDSGDVGGLFAVGQANIPTQTGKFDLNPQFVSCVPGVDLLGEVTKSINVKLNFVCEVVEEHTPENICRISPINNMFPSSLLTIGNIQLILKDSLVPKAGRRIFLQASLAIPEAEDSLQLSISPEANAFLPFSSTKPLVPAKKMFFPDPLEFILNPDINSPLKLTIDVYTMEGTKKKQILTGEFTFSKPFENQSIKLEAKGSMLTDMKDAFSKGDNRLSFVSLYPAIVAPLPNVKAPLLDRNMLPENHESMYQPIATYIIEQNITSDVLESADFNILFPMFQPMDMDEVQQWIEHYFAPLPGFAVMFANKLGDSLQAVEPYPLPFFRMLLKSICVEGKADYESVVALFDKCIATKSVNIIKSCSDFLLGLRMFDPEHVYRLAHHFVLGMTVDLRFIAYKFFFSDTCFVHALTISSFKPGQNASSPYVPLLSLFYLSLNQAFMKNDSQGLQNPAICLSLLATTLERFNDSKVSVACARTLFPLLPLIFTFHDSLKMHLTNDDVLVPIILFLLKNCQSQQFLSYYNILSMDNKLRFIEFLASLVSPKMIIAIAENSSITEDRVIAVAHEITWRVLMFIRVFSEGGIERSTDGGASTKKLSASKKPGDVDIVDTTSKAVQTLKLVFDLLIQLLTTPQQPDDSFDAIFKSLAIFVNKFQHEIFKEETTLLSQILTAVVSITQRKLATSRLDAIGFIHFLIDREKTFHSSCGRCNLALQFAVCDAFFQNEKFIPFSLPSDMSAVTNLYGKLTAAKTSSPLYELQNLSLLKLYDEYESFPAIRALIYSHIVKESVSHQDYISAFVTQWKLCALIAEVFKQRRTIVDGIPADGGSKFPLISSDKAYSFTIANMKDTGFIVMQSEMFTDSYISIALQESMDLCKQAGLHWLIGQTTEFLFDFLEKRREFSLLESLYEKVRESFAKLSEDDSSPLYFNRIVVTGPASKQLGISEFIHCGASGSAQELITRLQTICPDLAVIEDQKPLAISGSKSEVQVLKMRLTNRTQLDKLLVENFEYDFHLNQDDWDADYAVRFKYTAEFKMPASIPLVKIAKSEENKMKKKDYFIERYDTYHRKLSEMIHNISSVLPPPKMAEPQIWAKCPLGLNAGPLLHMIGRVAEPNETKEPWLLLANKLNTTTESVSAPDEIIAKAHDIWDVATSAMKLVDRVLILNPSPAEQMKVTTYRAIIPDEEFKKST